MAFTQQQLKALAAKLKRRFVKTRTSRGTKLSYLEGWHLISEANRIFGRDCWDRTTLSPQCIWADRSAGGATSISLCHEGPYHSSSRWHVHNS